MNKKLMEILEAYERGRVNTKEAHDQIIELWKERLPKKKANQEVSEYYSGYNQAIDEVQKNMN